MVTVRVRVTVMVMVTVTVRVTVTVMVTVMVSIVMKVSESKAMRGALHKGLELMADLMVENNITLNQLIQNIELRPTKESLKDVFREAGRLKYSKKSTEDLTNKELDETWQDMANAVGKLTGEYIHFPSLHQMMLEQEDIDNTFKKYES